MAVDTRDKRASATSVGMPYLPHLPAPDGDPSEQGDRAQAAGLYRGILPSLAVRLYRQILDVVFRNHTMEVRDTEHEMDVLDRDHTFEVQVREGES